ncbi:MAG: Transposase [Cenarchaeum symbiont of Oopsacas minuta]|nr:Transposase [Cenarchaeum symbiont of Oopsacas minuta]
MKKKGLDGLRDRPKSGTPPKVERRILEQIRNTVASVGCFIRPKFLRKQIFEMTGVKYSLQHVRKIMRSWNLSAKVPVKVHGKAASSKDVRRWHRSILSKIRRAIHKGYVILVQDEAIFTENGIHYAKYWTNVGERLIVPYNGKHQKFIVFGVVGPDGRSLFRSYEKFTSKTFVKFLKTVRAAYGRVMIIADQATQHTSRKVRNYLAECNGDIKLDYFPTASPYLSAIERCWGMCKLETIHSEYYESVWDMRSAVMNYLRTMVFKMDIFTFFKRRVIV